MKDKNGSVLAMLLRFKQAEPFVVCLSCLIFKHKGLCEKQECDPIHSDGLLMRNTF